MLDFQLTSVKKNDSSRPEEAVLEATDPKVMGWDGGHSAAQWGVPKKRR